MTNLQTYSRFSLLLMGLLFVSSSEAYALPAKVKSYLDQNYSGWKFSTLAETCTSGKSPAEISGDFDGNGKIDYAVKIKRGNKGYVIAFLSKGANYTPYVLENKSAIDIDDTALELIEGKIHVTNCESSSYFYIYRNGRFRTKFTSD